MKPGRNFECKGPDKDHHALPGNRAHLQGRVRGSARRARLVELGQIVTEQLQQPDATGRGGLVKDERIVMLHLVLGDS